MRRGIMIDIVRQSSVMLGCGMIFAGFCNIDYLCH